MPRKKITIPKIKNRRKIPEKSRILVIKIPALKKKSDSRAKIPTLRKPLKHKFFSNFLGIFKSRSLSPGFRDFSLGIFSGFFQGFQIPIPRISGFSEFFTRDFSFGISSVISGSHPEAKSGYSTIPSHTLEIDFNPQILICYRRENFESICRILLLIIYIKYSLDV